MLQDDYENTYVTDAIISFKQSEHPGSTHMVVALTIRYLYLGLGVNITPNVWISASIYTL